MKIRKILVPTDFSDASAAAAEVALDLAAQNNAEVIFFHVEIPWQFIGYSLSPAVQFDVGDVIEAKLEDLKQQAADRVETRSATRRGIDYEQIVKFAEEDGVDLIVLATHGYTGMKRLWLGSTTERVVRTASCPVLTIRPQDSAGA